MKTILFLYLPTKGKFKHVSAGHGDNIWAVNDYGSVYRKKGVNSMQPYGGDWQQISGVNLQQINAGLTGVFGVTKNGGYLVSHKGMYTVDYFIVCFKDKLARGW